MWKKKKKMMMMMIVHVSCGMTKLMKKVLVCCVCYFELMSCSVRFVSVRSYYFVSFVLCVRILSDVWRNRTCRFHMHQQEEKEEHSKKKKKRRRRRKKKKKMVFQK